MAFKFSLLSNDLLFATWLHRPHQESVEKQYLERLKYFLEKASGPLYILSDTRRGYLENPSSIRKLSKLTNHPHYGGMVRLGKLSTTPTAVKETLRNTTSVMTFNEVIRVLEQYQTGITDNINWDHVLSVSA